jgi:hypothetical protein
MNNGNRDQLKAAIPNRLVQVQSGHFATRELLRQYAPLEGIVTKSAPHILPEAGCGEPVENSLAPHATVAPNDSSPWHGATVAQDATVASGATVARYAEVKGELRVLWKPFHNTLYPRFGIMEGCSPALCAQAEAEAVIGRFLVQDSRRP